MRSDKEGRQVLDGIIYLSGFPTNVAKWRLFERDSMWASFQLNRTHGACQKSSSSDTNEVLAVWLGASWLSDNVTNHLSCETRRSFRANASQSVTRKNICSYKTRMEACSLQKCMSSRTSSFALVQVHKKSNEKEFDSKPVGNTLIYIRAIQGHFPRVSSAWRQADEEENRRVTSQQLSSRRVGQ